MSDEKLDKLSRALATTTSRRQMLKILAATVAGGVLSLAGAREAGAAAAEGSASPAAPTSSAATSSARPTPAGAPADRARTLQKTRRCISCDPRRRRPGNVPVRLSEGTTQCGNECCSAEEECCPGGYYGPTCCPPGEICCPGGFCSYYGGQC